jgi:hypothetical protein
MYLLRSVQKHSSFQRCFTPKSREEAVPDCVTQQSETPLCQSVSYQSGKRTRIILPGTLPRPEKCYSNYQHEIWQKVLASNSETRHKQKKPYAFHGNTFLLQIRKLHFHKTFTVQSFNKLHYSYIDIVR